MSKREVTWLLIRVTGLVFLWLSVECLAGFVVGYSVVMNSPLMPQGSSEMFLILILKAGLYFVLGRYCLSNGRLVFRLLNDELE